MPANKVLGEVLKFPAVRLSFPVLDEPEQYKGTGKHKYSVASLLDPRKAIHMQAWRAMETEIERMIREAWGRRPPRLKMQFHGKGEDRTNMETGEIYAGYEGMLWVSGKCEAPPKLVNTNKVVIDGREQFEPIDGDDPDLLGGMIANVTYNLYIPDEKEWGPQIACGLRGVQALGKGEPFGGASARDTLKEFGDFDSDDPDEGNVGEIDDGLGGDDIPF